MWPEGKCLEIILVAQFDVIYSLCTQYFIIFTQFLFYIVELKLFVTRK